MIRGLQCFHFNFQCQLSSLDASTKVIPKKVTGTKENHTRTVPRESSRADSSMETKKSERPLNPPQWPSDSLKGHGNLLNRPETLCKDH